MNNEGICFPESWIILKNCPDEFIAMVMKQASVVHLSASAEIPCSSKYLKVKGDDCFCDISFCGIGFGSWCRYGRRRFQVPLVPQDKEIGDEMLHCLLYNCFFN